MTNSFRTVHLKGIDLLEPGKKTINLLDQLELIPPLISEIQHIIQILAVNTQKAV